MKRNSILLVLIFSILSTALTAQNQAWKIVRPTNNGVPGPHVRFGKFDPQGNLWVAARWPSWMEGGISKYDGTKWTAYSNVDSWMPTSIIHDVAFQSNGVAWIGTDAGLIRFDGTNAQLFDMTNAPFPSNNIKTVCIDGAGNIWFLSKEPSTIAHAVIKYDGSNWTVFNSSNSGIPYFDICALAVGPDNKVWVGTWALGIAVYDGSQWTNYNSGNSNFNGGQVSGFEFTPNGDVWVSSGPSGIYKFSNNVWQNISALPGNHDYSTVALHPDGTLWFGTYGGLLVKYDGTAFTSYPYGNHLYTIDFDSQGNVWAGGLAEIKKYVNTVNTLTYSVYNTSLTSYFIENMDFFPNGTGWFATSMGGVCSYDGTVWRGFNPYNHASEPWTFIHNSANDIYIDQQTGNVWVGSNGVGYWNGSSWTIFTLGNSNIPDNEVCHVTKDNQERIWIGTAGYGAAFYNGSVWTQLNFGSYSSNRINDIQTAPDGSIWFATELGLHQTTDGINFITYYQSNSGLPSDWITAIAFEPNGTMWIGTINGLVKWVNNTWTVYTESNSGLPANHISDIELGVAGTIWVSAHQLQTWPYYGGISKYDGATWTTYTPGNSPLSHIQVEKLKFDPTGMLWISTYSMGMMKFTIPVGGPLPLTLLSFTARKNENKVLLEWKTTLEENTDRFVIERTFDQFAFQPIGTVNAVGFSQNQTSYSFIDEHPGAGNNYYRLKMIDRDGKFTYSQIVRINFGSVDAGFVINTNPVRSELILSYSGANQSVSINMYDAAGRIVIKTNAANEPVIRIGVANLKAGVYIIELIDSEKVYRKKFLKVD